jgi:hypothetical protein
MLKKICFSADLKKTALQNGSRRAEPDQKNLARRQDGPEFSNPEVWTEHDEYMILMDEPDYEIDVLPAYPGSLTSLTENIKNHKKKIHHQISQEYGLFRDACGSVLTS